MTLTPTGPGLTLALVSIILLAFSWVTVVARVIVRFGIKALGSDDYLMVAGLVCLPELSPGDWIEQRYLQGFRYSTLWPVKRPFQPHTMASVRMWRG